MEVVTGVFSVTGDQEKLNSGRNGAETGFRGNQWVPEPNPPSKLAQQYPVTVTGVFGVTTNKADKSTLIEAKMA